MKFCYPLHPLGNMMWKKKFGRVTIFLSVMTALFIGTYIYMLKLNVLIGGRYLFSQPSSHIFHNMQRGVSKQMGVDGISKLRKQSIIKTRNSTIKTSIIVRENIKFVSHMMWDDFVKLPLVAFCSELHSTSQWAPKLCSAAVDSRLLAPRLSKEEHDWCVYANKIRINKINFKEAKMGWGLYMSHLRNYTKFSCNHVTIDNKLDSCSHLYGDMSLYDYVEVPNVLTRTECNRGSSIQRCIRNAVNETFCEIENAMVDFSRFAPVTKVNRKGISYISKDFNSNFLSSDCHSPMEEKIENISDIVSPDENIPLNHLYSPVLSASHCDYTHQGKPLIIC